MLPKKNSKADLNKNSTPYFLIGLVLILLIVWRAIEFKTYERDIELDRLSVMDDDEEDIPITEMTPHHHHFHRHLLHPRSSKW